MLILKRKAGETIVITSPTMIEQVLITVMDIQGQRIKLGIEAPADIIVSRQELLDAGRTRESETPAHDY